MKPTRTILAAAAVTTLALSATAPAQTPTAATTQTTTSFFAARSGEALIELTGAAPGSDWGAAGVESAVVGVRVDGRLVEDVVLFAGADPFVYRAAIGRVSAGRHQLEVVFEASKSPPAARRPRIHALRARLADADEALAARYSPIVIGRDIPEVPGHYENNHTDVPLLQYHTRSADAQGRTVLEYTQVWSNEDGGTKTPALMARWGRTTDIEWIYRITLDGDGRPVSEVYQAHRAGGPARRRPDLVPVQPRRAELVDPARRPGGHDRRAAAGDHARRRPGRARRSRARRGNHALGAGPGRLPHRGHRAQPWLHARPVLLPRSLVPGLGRLGRADAAAAHGDPVAASVMI